MESLSRLVCGSPVELGEASKVLGYLRHSIASFANKTESLLQCDANESDLAMFGPFCARVIMETACASLVGRIDPFRVLYLSRFQSREGYDPTKRAKSAFMWQGDVVPPDKEKEKDDIWSEATDTSKISRALLSPYLDHLHWRPAALAALDHAVKSNSNRHIAAFLLIDADHFVLESKGRGAAIYSRLSKGVHWEFFTGNAVILDKETVKDLVRDAIGWTAKLAFVSHFVQTAHGCLSADDAVSAYIKVMELVHVG